MPSRNIIRRTNQEELISQVIKRTLGVLDCISSNQPNLRGRLRNSSGSVIDHLARLQITPSFSYVWSGECGKKGFYFDI